MIKPIQTRYAGYLFRSRLEARWAVFFDALKLDWQYEPEGFELPSGIRYLPDFRISLCRGPLWAEVKPSGGTSPPFKEFIFNSDIQRRGTILHEIPDPRKDYYGHDVIFNDYPGGTGDSNYVFCKCSNCHRIGFEFNGYPERMKCCAIPGSEDVESIKSAFAKARSARFEHEARETYLSS